MDVLDGPSPGLQLAVGVIVAEQFPEHQCVRRVGNAWAALRPNPQVTLVT